MLTIDAIATVPKATDRVGRGLVLALAIGRTGGIFKRLNLTRSGRVGTTAAVDSKTRSLRCGA